MVIERILELEEIFVQKNWPIEKDLKLYSSLFNRFSNRLSLFEGAEQKFLLDLTRRFLNMRLNDITNYFFSAIRLIKNIDSYTQIFLTPLKSPFVNTPKSADYLWYHLKNFCDFNYETFGKKYILLPTGV